MILFLLILILVVLVDIGFEIVKIRRLIEEPTELTDLTEKLKEGTDSLEQAVKHDQQKET